MAVQTASEAVADAFQRVVHLLRIGAAVAGPCNLRNGVLSDVIRSIVFHNPFDDSGNAISLCPLIHHRNAINIHIVCRCLFHVGGKLGSAFFHFADHRVIFSCPLAPLNGDENIFGKEKVFVARTPAQLITENRRIPDAHLHFCPGTEAPLIFLRPDSGFLRQLLRKRFDFQLKILFIGNRFRIALIVNGNIDTVEFAVLEADNRLRHNFGKESDILAPERLITCGVALVRQPFETGTGFQDGVILEIGGSQLFKKRSLFVETVRQVKWCRLKHDRCRKEHGRQ